jgi:hypothetical protein
MTNVVFNRESLEVVGLNRPALPFEVEIKNVDVIGLTKEYDYIEKVQKKDEEGNLLYLLPQDSIEVIGTQTVWEETTEVTEYPVTVKEIKKYELYDANNNLVKYQPTQLGEVTEVTDEPVMIDVVNEETNEPEQVQKTDEEGNLLYWAQVPVGDPIQCYTTEEVEVQKVDSNGKKIYQKEVEHEVLTQEQQPDLEITNQDERYTEELEPALEDENKTRTVSFDSEANLFTYADIATYKEKQLIRGTFFDKAVLVETMEGTVFDPSVSADTGFDFISFAPTKNAETNAITLPSEAQTVHIVSETNVSGLEILIGSSLEDLQPVDNMNERNFDAPVSEVFVQFINNTDQRIDLYSFALLV